MPHEIGGERLVIGEEGRQLEACRDTRGAGERGDVDEQFRLLAVGFGERVGEHQAAFGIGVADLDA